LKQKGYIKK